MEQIYLHSQIVNIETSLFLKTVKVIKTKMSTSPFWGRIATFQVNEDNLSLKVRKGQFFQQLSYKIKSPSQGFSSDVWRVKHPH